MRHTWRWFGPVDKVRVEDAAQAGAHGIVSSLHHLPTGSVWATEEIEKRKQQILAGGLSWDIVESIPISEDIKTGTGDYKAHLAAWQENLRRLKAAGIETICYNFMPVLDWTRTDLRWTTANGAKTMRFDLIDFIAFDLHILQRPDAEADYQADLVAEASERFKTMSPADIRSISNNVGAGLPGSTEVYSLDELRAHLRRYAGIDAAALQNRLIDFLSEVAPVAEELGMRLCAHGDDPPWPLLGLPRILSKLEDYEKVLAAVDMKANGVTFCTGSLGARSANDLPAMIRKLAPRLHFLHLRNVKREDAGTPCSFYEDEHLEGDTDMVAVVAAVLEEEKRRKAEGRADNQIPMRPDHGQEILDDLTRGAQPGYPAIGRLKGLAELRGIERALSHSSHGMN
ncbi:MULTISPECIES: mannonate dehydratase [unclassified Rhizobium]|uniref:mannonate dehydratase n=1 Tax=unclassified Rhizobium TaxID=2613769 RepID=UPI001ADB010D|nr:MULTISPECIES: mannonate dehydratase [unclassified Rhizobium]MBO9123728.1 mannonate dehydratase [Rhizobium sp. 16-488-2b]MBO9174260.1 mannonate dehydratase [Rhizobium sp. 16-488-2a]